ncbi:XRE family transcriptional regulator [Streptomyces sp. GC420]|uniref:XRE family transcriptional regulator n=1 Tax=Streptomyces sp. GC420 TaxID=2697568 RepID=UPI001415257E|nr:XRE family transcriptional regulator [Streptomyces sp. GC420]NBM20226.1 DUF2690 domain-containing protein [Streptomyces sp. GC420]
MPRWKALPDGLDPQVREFTSQLRRLVDRSGMSIAAVADSTGYSKTSWERYLNGRLLAPKGAVVALAEVTGTNPVHLTTMWELAERAWSRSEMRHDMTMEAIRISQARAALSEFGPGPANQGGGRGGSAAHTQRRGSQENTPTQTAADLSGGRPGGGQGVPPGAPRPASSPAGQRGRRKMVMFAAGIVGALLVVAAAVLFTDLGGGDKEPEAKPTPSPTVSETPERPEGVECTGKECTGEDPEQMGCGGELARTVANATVGTAVVEVRYSETCGAAWARVTQAAAGDKVTIATAGSKTGAQQDAVDAGTDTDAYTPMLAVADPADAEACVALATGEKGCTE